MNPELEALVVAFDAVIQARGGNEAEESMELITPNTFANLPVRGYAASNLC